MTTTLSKELRWFFEVHKAKPIKDWFAHLPRPQKFRGPREPLRLDYYLKMPEVNNLGVKVREPKKDAATGKSKTAFEIKQRILDNSYVALPNNNKAYVNTWQKVSYGITEGAVGILHIDFSFPPTDERWIKLQKDRLIIKYDVLSKSLSEHEDLTEACGIELTKIGVAGKTYYSFGLEAFSESGKYLDDNFQECCTYVFKHIDVRDFKLTESLSYPEFLAAL